MQRETASLQFRNLERNILPHKKSSRRKRSRTALRHKHIWESLQPTSESGFTIRISDLTSETHAYSIGKGRQPSSNVFARRGSGGAIRRTRRPPSRAGQCGRCPFSAIGVLNSLPQPLHLTATTAWSDTCASEEPGQQYEFGYSVLCLHAWFRKTTQRKMLW